MFSYKLDKDIFNPTLYKRIRESFFEGQSLDAVDVAPEVMKRWFGGSPEEKEAFDSVCRREFGPALEAFGPEKFPMPDAGPFLREIQEVAEKNKGGDGSEVAWTALSIVLLLDQVPRNIYRTNEGLFKVYSHYDKIACPLMLILLSPNSPIGRPDLHPQWRKSMVHRMWFYLPLMHSEEDGPHELQKEIFRAFEKELVQEGGNEDRLKFVRVALEQEHKHRDLLYKFGRYPHRNLALGRQSTTEERKFLSTGGSTFGVAQVEK